MPMRAKTEHSGFIKSSVLNYKENKKGGKLTARSSSGPLDWTKSGFRQ
jgi:hypothetical protein